MNTGPVVKEGDFEMIRGVVGIVFGGISDKPADGTNRGWEQLHV